jgi:diguanylate cyclase (GGDEF)-like protein
VPIKEENIESKLQDLLKDYGEILNFLDIDVFLLIKHDETYKFLINEGPIANKLGINTKKIEKGIDKVIGTDFTNKLSAYYKRAFENNQVKYRVRMKGIVFETLLIPLETKDGKTEHVLGISKDISKEEKLMMVNKQLEEEKNKAEKKDCIVNSYNRNTLKQILLKELNLINEDNNLALVLFDLDQLNNVNDVYGHTVGDKILQEVSDLCCKSIRRSDYFGRWTGGQFLLIAPHSSKEGINRVAERLRLKIENFNFINNIKLTASFGVIVCNEEIGYDKLVWSVEKAMQKAKRMGKNRINLESF